MAEDSSQARWQRASARRAAWVIVAMACLSGAVRAAAPPGMVWIPGGQFRMGSEAEGSQANEGPEHEVWVDGFWMDATEVTNEAFARFVKETGYLTVAERPVDWNELKKQVPPGTPKPDDSMLQPGSLVFVKSEGPVPLQDLSRWWRWTLGASWQHPEGPGSSLEGRDQHPVVHVAYEDAEAYARWARKRLPTEAEWERAARGGLEGERFCWGDTPPESNESLVNHWTGTFPFDNTAADGFIGTCPVRSFPAIGYGLYEMCGNVWEWCSDWYQPDSYRRRDKAAITVNPQGPSVSFNPAHPYEPKERVIRGGSYLCHVSYCESYRPSARRGTPVDTGSTHAGFRCVKSVEAGEGMEHTHESE